MLGARKVAKRRDTDGMAGSRCAAGRVPAGGGGPKDDYRVWGRAMPRQGKSRTAGRAGLQRRQAARKGAMSEPLAYFEGRLIPQSEARLPLHDAGFVMGATITDLCRTVRHRL